MSAVVWESVFWGVAAVLLYGLMLHLTWLAFKPKPQGRMIVPDWFWDPKSGWEWSIRWAGDDPKPEQTDPPESKPTSGAG